MIMRRVTEKVAADGKWQALSQRPVASIEASLDGMIDITSDGVGWVRFPHTDGCRREVEYTITEAGA